MHPHASLVAESNSAVPDSSLATDTLDRVLHHARRLHYRKRAQLQRKHLLHALAVEAGHVRWEGYRDALRTLTPEQVTQAHMTDRWPASINVWFSNEAQARAAVGDDARLQRFGTQFVVDGRWSERVS